MNSKYYLMGRASQRKKRQKLSQHSSNPTFNRSQLKESILHSKAKPYIDESILDQLLDIPEISILLEKIDNLPPTDYEFSPLALELFQKIKKASAYQISQSSHEDEVRFWLDFPNKAADIAISLHLMNGLCNSDTVSPIITLNELQQGMALTYSQFKNGQHIPPFIPLIDQS